MKILQILHCFPPESMTGAEIYAYNLAKCLLLDKHEVSVFYRISNPKEEDYKVLKDSYGGLTVYKINNTLKRYNIEKIYRNKDIESKFIEILEEVKPDIAHIHHLLFLSTGIIDEIKKRNIPIIFTLHDYWLVCPRGQLFRPGLKLCDKPLEVNCIFCLAGGLNCKNLLKRLLRLPTRGGVFSKRPNISLKDIYAKVNLFIAPSNFLRNKFMEFGMPQEKIVYSDNGMNLDLFKDIEKTKSDKIRFGFIGTLIPSKGAHVLIKAFNKIKDNRAVLRIYGHSPVNNGIFDYYHRIKRMSSGNKDIKFMGKFDNKDAAKIFKEIDILVFPSIWQENSPLVLHEAIMSNTFVIASDTGGVNELIKHKKNGFLFKPGDVNQLYLYMQDAINNIDYLSSKAQDSDICIKSIQDNSKEIEKIYVEKINNR